MSTYFIHQKDPQREEAMKFDRKMIDDYIEPFMNKTVKIVLFVDFENLPTDIPVTFIYVSFKNVTYSINDYRFFLYLEFLNANEFSQVLMTDLSDVRFGRDPFEYFVYVNRTNLYIGNEEKRNFVWMNSRKKECWNLNKEPELVNKSMESLKKHKFIQVNAGVFGGEYGAVLDVLRSMVNMFSDSGQKPFCNSDMVVFGAAIFPFWERHEILFGQPFTSPYKHYLFTKEMKSTYVIFHKRM